MADNYLLLKGASGETVKVRLKDLGDGTYALKTETDVVLNVDSVTVTDVTIKDHDDGDNKLKINADGSVNAQLVGSNMENYGKPGDSPPDVSTVPLGATFTIVDEKGEYPTVISNGTKWGEA